MTLEAWLAILAAPFIGSFLGVVVRRLPASRPIGLARSTCDVCGAVLRPRDMVPLLSWLVRRGRCRCGRVALPVFYPAIEVAALAVALWAATVLEGWLLLATCALGWALLALAAIDLDHGILPDVLTLPLIPAGLALAWMIDPAKLMHHLAGAGLGYLAFTLIGQAYRRLRGREGLGGGDARLLAAAGAWVGWQGLPSVVVFGALAGLGTALIRAGLGERLASDTRLAFGPHLALGMWLVWLYGPLVLV